MVIITPSCGILHRHIHRIYLKIIIEHVVIVIIHTIININIT